MKLVILAGGLGTRISEETEVRPKPMVEIGGRPILWHIMKHYAHYGFDDFVLCLGYKGNMIKEHFLNYEAMNNDVTLTLGANASIEHHGAHNEAGFRVTLADTGLDTMTGKRIKVVQKYVDGDTFMLKAGPKHEIVRTNAVEEPVYSSPAIANGRIYIRGQKHLFAIGS